MEITLYMCIKYHICRSSVTSPWIKWVASFHIDSYPIAMFRANTILLLLKTLTHAWTFFFNNLYLFFKCIEIQLPLFTEKILSHSVLSYFTRMTVLTTYLHTPLREEQWAQFNNWKYNVVWKKVHGSTNWYFPEW